MSGEADVAAHLARWAERRATAERLFTLEAPELGWAQVAAFYAALHLVQAYLLTKGERFHADNHGARQRALHAAPELRPRMAAYRSLQSRSEAVRYHPAFRPAEADRDEVRSWLRRVEGVLEGKLAARGYPPP